MDKLDVMFSNVKTVEINNKTFKIAPLGPYLMGRIVNYIKEKKRTEIINVAKEIGNTSLAEINKLLKDEFAELTPKYLDLALIDADVLTHFVLYDLQVYQPEISYVDMGKIGFSDVSKTSSKILESLSENPTKNPEGNQGKE